MFRSLVFTEISLFKISSSEFNSDLSCRVMMTQNTTTILGIYPEVENLGKVTTGSECDACRRSGDRAYTEEPLADEKWLKEYEQQQAEKDQRLEGLTDILSAI